MPPLASVRLGFVVEGVEGRCDVMLLLALKYTAAPGKATNAGAGVCLLRSRDVDKVEMCVGGAPGTIK
eukprot:1191048-Prorocentrum_minimum.AAC.6